MDDDIKNLDCDMLINPTIGRMLQTARESGRLTREELANQLEQPISAEQLAGYEEGKTHIPASELGEFAEILGVPVERFFSTPLGPEGNA